MNKFFVLHKKPMTDGKVSVESLKESKAVLDVQVSNIETKMSSLREMYSRYDTLSHTLYSLDQKIRWNEGDLNDQNSVPRYMRDRKYELNVENLQKRNIELRSQREATSKETKSLEHYYVEYEALSKERSHLLDGVRKLKTEIKKIEMLPMYEEYLRTLSEEHWDYKSASDILNGESKEDIFTWVNKKHQEKLIEEGYLVERSELYRLDRGDCEDEYCRGWFTNSKRCECCNYKCFRWEYDENDERFSDILEFNIDSTIPIGYVTVH